MNIVMEAVYIPSQDVVAREIEGELIIVPLAAGMGDQDDELYTLNETGREIWGRLDGRHNLAVVIQELAEEYAAKPQEIEADVSGLMMELLRRKMLVKAS